jgi:HNH endonuclease
MAGSNVARLEREPAWLVAHETLSRLAKQRAAADAEEGRCLLAALRSAAHVHLGFGSFNEYIERLLGYKPRSTQEKLRVAEALAGLPVLARALEEGALSWSAVRELTRVAAPENEREWLELAHGKTIRQLEELVAGKGLGDSPSEPSRPELQRHVLHFEVSAETFALFREAMSAVRRNSGAPLDDDASLLTMARHALGGPSDDGRASYQIVLSRCPGCNHQTMHGGGTAVSIDDACSATAECDAQQIGHVDVQPANENAHVGAAGSNHHTADPAHAVVRAKQTIPPAVRRSVLLRDHRRCRVPGCRNATFVDVHHIRPRSEGGVHDADNLVTLCGAHHRATHRHELVIDGSTATSVRFRHADGEEYGRVLEPRSIAVRVKVSAALRGLGFREGEVRAALRNLEASNDLTEANAEHLLREALLHLTSAGQAVREGYSRG